MKIEEITVELKLTQLDEANEKTDTLIEKLETARNLMVDLKRFRELEENKSDVEINFIPESDKVYIVFHEYNKEIEGVYFNKTTAENACNEYNKMTDSNEHTVREFEIIKE